MKHSVWLLPGLIFALTGCPGEPSTDDLEAAIQEIQQSRIVDETKALGKCNTEKNRQYLFLTNHAFAEKWSSCSGYSGLDTQCLKENYPDMTIDCMNCFAAMTSCGVSNCKATCAPWIGYGQRSIECKECSARYCGAEMTRCTGLLPAELPDFKR